MPFKKAYFVVLLFVFSLAGWKVWDMVKQQQEKVLGATTAKTLDERVASLESRVYLLEKNAGLINVRSTKPVESYVNLVGGNFSNTGWSKISETDFTFDTSLYGKNVEIAWQGWVSGKGSVRLYDATNHRAVDFSEFTSTSDGKTSFYSKVLSIWRGQNQYYIEGRVVGGEASITLAKLKIVVK